MQTRISLLARAVPRIAVAYTMRSGALSPPGLALVARCTSPLLLSPSEPASVGPRAPAFTGATTAEKDWAIKNACPGRAGWGKPGQSAVLWASFLL